MAGSGINLYQYAGGDPTNLIDPTGYSLASIGEAITGFGDMVSGGLTRDIRGDLGIGQPDFSSPAYNLGADAGLAAAALSGDEEGVGADVAADAADAGEETGPSFIGFTDGPPAVVPDGADGPVPPESGSGMVFRGGEGGHGLSSNATGVRIMDDPPRTVYMNKEDQTINPYNGRTIERKDPWAHLP
jgi:hypothetical protein